MRNRFLKTTAILLPCVLAVVFLAAERVCAKTTIIVDFGSHPSAQAAGHSEAEINWLDVDTVDDTTCTECFAALELQHYLRKMTARPDDFAIADDDRVPQGDLILVGGPISNVASRRLASALGVAPKPRNKLGPQGYRIKSAVVDGRRITMIFGGSRVGTLYGAYDLLYRMGCRWFAPGKLHEEVPKVEQLANFDVTERPAFGARGFYAWEPRGNPDFLLWMARNRLNEWCVDPELHSLMHKLGIRIACGEHDAMERFLNPGKAYSYNHAKFQGDDKNPPDPYPLSKQYQGDANGDGELSYFEAHPEWFPLVNGRRVPGMRGHKGTNYCTSNPQATGEFIKNFVQALIDGPYREAEIVRLWLLDCARWCSCEECKALGTPTDRNLRLVYQLDQAIKKARAEGKIGRPILIRFLVYEDVIEPPTRPLPADFDYETCIGTFFPIGRCYVHNFDVPDCPRNARYSAQLPGWTTDPDRHYRGQICIGEYYNVSGYKCLPICFMHTQANDIPHFYKAGGRHFHYMHVTTGNWGSKALTNYQMARQVWDVDTDCEALWNDYFTRRYGPVADTMRSFYESLEKTFSNIREMRYNLAIRLHQGDKTIFTVPHLQFRREPGVKCDGPTLVEIVGHAKTCRRLIDQALATELPERIQARVEEDDGMFTYGERTIDYYYECAQAFLLGRSGRLDEARRHYANAQRVAELLRQIDTTAEKFQSSPAIADDNAFLATRASGALKHLARLLEPADAQDTKKKKTRSKRKEAT